MKFLLKFLQKVPKVKFLQKARPVVKFHQSSVVKEKVKLPKRQVRQQRKLAKQQKRQVRLQKRPVKKRKKRRKNFRLKAQIEAVNPLHDHHADAFVVDEVLDVQQRDGGAHVDPQRAARGPPEGEFGLGKACDLMFFSSGRRCRASRRPAG